MAGAHMLRVLAIGLSLTAAAAQTIPLGFVNKETWTSTTVDKTKVYPTIGFGATITTDELITFKLYIVAVDDDGGCGASDNDGKLISIVDTLTGGTPTCTSGTSTLVNFNGSYAGCEVNARPYVAPTLSSTNPNNQRRIRIFAANYTSPTLPSGTNRSPVKDLITELMEDGHTVQQDICFILGTSTPVDCSCTAGAPSVGIVEDVKPFFNKTATEDEAYQTLGLSNATGYTMYIIDVDAPNGCGRTGNTGYIHGIVRNIKMSDADTPVDCPSGTTEWKFHDNAKGCQDDEFKYAKPAPPDGTDEHTYKIYITNKDLTGSEPGSNARSSATNLMTALELADSGTDKTTSTELCFDSDNQAAVSCDCSYEAPTTEEATTEEATTEEATTEEATTEEATTEEATTSDVTTEATTTSDVTTGATTAVTSTSGASFTTLSVATTLFAGVCLARA